MNKKATRGKARLDPIVRLPRGFGRLPRLPKLPPGLAEIFSKPPDPSETLPRELFEPETRQGFIAQAMWDEPERDWFDVAPMVKTAPDAAKVLEDSQAEFEKRRHRPECVRKGIVATRIVRRTVTDEPWPNAPAEARRSRSLQPDVGRSELKGGEA
jgi:hypothetical protein